MYYILNNSPILLCYNLLIKFTLYFYDNNLYITTTFMEGT